MDEGTKKQLRTADISTNVSDGHSSEIRQGRRWRKVRKISQVMEEIRKSLGGFVCFTHVIHMQRYSLTRGT